MDSFDMGDLVTVSGTGPDLEGIVVEMPSRTKVVVGVVEPGRGPVFRTVDPKALTPREGEAESDAAVRGLIRRSGHPSRGAARGGSAGGKPAAGFSRGASHRPTGR